MSSEKITIRSYSIKTPQGKTFEGANNKYVKKALEKVSDMQSEKFEDGFACIKDTVNKLKTIKYAGYTKSNSIFPHILNKMKFSTGDEKEFYIYDYVINFMNQVKRDIEDIISHDKPEPTLFETVNEKLMFNLSPHIFSCDGRSPENAFKTRICFYNPLVNFEHVCFVFALIASDRYKIENDKSYPDIIVYNFNYFLEKYLEDRKHFKYVICHLMKLIRVYYINSLSTERAPNMFKSMSDLYFNINYNDPNLELYGNVRISNNFSILDNFMFAPRVKYPLDTREDILWFDYNKNCNIVSKMSKNAEEVYNNMIYMDKFKSVKALFLYFSHMDIAPRFEIGYNNIITPYRHIRETEDSDFSKYIINFFKKSNLRAPTENDMETYKHFHIGLSYIDIDGEVASTVFDNLTFEKFIEVIYSLDAGCSDHGVKEEVFINCFSYNKELQKYKLEKITQEDPRFKELLAESDKINDDYEYKVKSINVFLEKTFY